MDYLTRALNERVAGLRKTCGKSLDAIMMNAARAGRLASGATLSQFTDECLGSFEKAYLGAQQFAFNLTGGHEDALVAQLQASATQMIDGVMKEVTERSSRLGIQGSIIPNQLNVIHRCLMDKRSRLTDDFQHGMFGSERLKKDPLVNVINTQTNSPGAIQQVGIGSNFSQSAFTKNHQDLINAIDRALSSAEFVGLAPPGQEAFSDVAAVVKDEAGKPEPDVGKLRRWGGRLADISKDLGMNVAANEIVALLASIFGG
jgi:hypothetical protein